MNREKILKEFKKIMGEEIKEMQGD